MQMWIFVNNGALMLYILLYNNDDDEVASDFKTECSYVEAV